MLTEGSSEATKDDVIAILTRAIQIVRRMREEKYGFAAPMFPWEIDAGALLLALESEGAMSKRIGYDPKLGKFTQAQLQRDTQAVLSGKNQIKVVRKDA